MGKKNSNRHRQAYKNKFNKAKNLINNEFAQMQMNGGVERVTDLSTFSSDDRVYTDLDQIIKDIKKGVECGIWWATRIAFEITNVAVENWYNDYTPKEYYRTDTLYNNYVVWDSGSYASGNHGQIAVNKQYLSYVYPMKKGDKYPHSGRDVLDKAEFGVHGARFSQPGNEYLGIWRELISFINDNQWGATADKTVNGTYGESQILDAAFDVGVYTRKKVKKSWDLK